MFRNNRETDNIMKDQKDRSESIDTLIGEDSVLRGDLRFKSCLYVQGTVEGNIDTSDSSSGEFRLFQTGRLIGKVTAPHLIINGEVEGDLYATERIELQANARVTGNIYYKSIEMQLGAQVNGQLKFDEPGAPVSIAPEHGREKSGKKTG